MYQAGTAFVSDTAEAAAGACFFAARTRLLCLACSRRSDSGARAKKKASERAGKKRGEAGEEDERTPVKLILKSS